MAGLSPSPRALLARAAWRARPARPGRLYAQLRESQWWSPGRLHELQVELLRDLLEAAIRAPFYDTRLRAAGLVAKEIDGIRALGRLPPLERDELQSEAAAGLRVPGRRGIQTCSSGSTGAPVSTIWPREMIAWFEANDRRCNEWFGVHAGERRLNVAASLSARKPRRRAGAVISNVVRVSALDVADPRAAQRCALALERDPPALVWGVSNSLYALALAVIASGRRIPARVCISEGNRLLEPYREALEEAFGCPVFERYGSWETGILAHECPEAGSLHVLAEGVLVEVVDEHGGPAAPGTVGHVLVTSLRNRGLPLLRYRIGDLVEAPPPGACPCGRGLPVLGRLIGRSNELLLMAGGGLVPPEAVSAVMTSAAASVVEFQVIQQEDLSLDVKLVQRGEPSPEAYRRRIADALDGLVRLPGATRIEPVARIPLTGAGKLRHVVSRASSTGERP